MRLCEPFRFRADDGGSILILALWVTFLLALLAVAVGAHIEGRVALAHAMEGRAIGRQTAVTAVERSLLLLGQDTNSWDSIDEPWGNHPESFSNVICGAGQYSMFWLEDLPGGEKGINFGVGDEQAFIDLNLARVEVLTALLQEVGGMGAEQAGRVAAAIQTARTKPVENSPGMSPKTGWVDKRLVPGPFRSVEELRWVEGMTEDVFGRIRRIVTVHGAARVNINTAGASVLQVLARAVGGKEGVQSLARKILQFRQNGGIFKTYLGAGMADTLGSDVKLAGDERSHLYGMVPFITMASDHFRGHIEATPLGRTEPVYRVEFVWNRVSHKIEFWHED